MPRPWTHNRATYVAAVGSDHVGADVVAFLFDLAIGHPALRVRAGKGSHPTFLADLRGSDRRSDPGRGRKLPSLFSVALFNKLVYFLPERIDQLIIDRLPDWFTSRLSETFGPSPGVGAKQFYRHISMSDLA